jgi:hypothetical protein
MRLMGLVVVLAVNLTLAPLAGEAQRTEQVYRVGVVFVGEATPADDARAVPGLMPAFLDRLADHGYVKGKNLIVEMRRVPI